MRSRILSGAFLALIVVFSACKKDKNSIDPVVTPPSTNAALVAKVDGVNFQSKDAGALASNDSHTFLLSATDAQDNSISLTGPTALGTYTEANDETSGFYITKNGALWMSSMGGTVTLTITKYDVNSKKMSGTFTFTAPAAGSDATGTKTVTNGSFTDVPFLVQ